MEEILPADVLVEDKKAGIVLGKQADVFGAVYADNFGVGSPSKETADSYLDLAIERFKEIAFIAHEVEYAKTESTFLGLQLSQSVVRIKKSRIWRLKHAIEDLLVQ
eukprot:4709533-Karenia_brevis.AAC.1